MPNGSQNTLTAPPPDPRLDLTTLGPSPHLGRDGTVVLGPGKPLALIIYLAVAPGHTATREFLLDLLWSDLEPDRARHALRQTLWYLRTVLGESAIRGREELTLTVTIDSDRGRFLAAISRGDPDAAVDAYQGEFLPGFALPGSTEFEHWAEIERSRLRASFVRMGEMVVRRRLAAGRAREAQTVARRIRDADRLNEAGWRLVLESLMAGRDFVQAAIDADTLVRSFGAEGRPLEPATRRLVAEAQRDPDRAPATTELGSPDLVADLIGREREFATILDTWQRARHGPAEHVHISAAAGLGKSRLLADLGHRFGALGIRTRTLRAPPGDRAVPYSFAGDLAATLGDLPGLGAVSPGAADALVDLSPALSARFAMARPLPNRHELLRLRTSALVEAVTAVADEQPFVLLLDDIHWLDPESRQVIVGLLARLNGAPVLVVTAGRPIGGGAVDGPRTTSLDLAPLGAAEIGTLVTSLGRWPDAEVLTAVVGALARGTDGSPLLVLETLQLSLERDLLTLAGDAWRCADVAKLLAELGRGSALKSRFEALDREAAWVLLVLATAGTPLTEAELRTAIRAPDHLPAQLWNLERHGFVRRSGNSWDVAHDEMAATSLEAESADRTRAAHSAVAQALLGQPAAPVGAVIRACRHAAAAQNDALAKTAFRRLVRTARDAGDTRRLRVLAADASGAGDDETIGRLVRGLSWRTRLHLDSDRRLVAVAVAAVALFAFIMTTPARARSAAERPTLVVVTGTGDLRRVSLVQVGPNLAGGDSLRPAGAAAMTGIPRRYELFDVSPDGKHWVGSFKGGNRLTDEIAAGVGTEVETIASAERDDSSPVRAGNDGLIAFATARWSPRGDDDADIAIYDPHTRQVRQLTSGRAHDVYPHWSPDNARLAFSRRHFGHSSEVCWVTIDGSRERCRPAPDLLELVGWASATRVMLLRDSVERRLLTMLDIDTGTERTVGTANPVTARLSPDGQWVACLCRVAQSDLNAWTVFRTDAPEVLYPLATPETPAQILWARGSVGVGPLTRLVVSKPEQPLPVGGSYRLGLVGLDPAGRAIDVPVAVLSWRSTDSSIASVDSAGIVRSHRPGAVSVTVSAGGQTTTEVDVTVIGPSPRDTLVAEDWNSPVDARWRLFGTPLPQLMLGRGGIRSFNNNGDGSFPSGAYSRSAYSVGRGLAIEAMVSVPVNRDHWQGLTVTLLDDEAFAHLGAWDHRDGQAPFVTELMPQSCELSFGGEAPYARERVTIMSLNRDRSLAVPRSFYNGDWHTIRVQIMMDGSCGVAVDGTPRWRLDGRLPTSHKYRVLILGQSAGTTLLVGPLRLWQGTPDDVAWPTSP